MKERDLLNHVTVAEIGDDIFVRYSGRILADFGAKVIRIWRPEGDSETPEWLDWFLDHDKGTVTTIDEALQQATVVFVDPQRRAAESRCGELERDIGSGRSDCILAVVGAFGAAGPYSRFAGTSLTAYHAGGEGMLQPVGADESVPPVQPTALIAAHDTAVLAATVAIASLIRRRRSGRGAVLDVSAQEAILTLNRTVWAKNVTSHHVETRAGRRYGVGGTLPTRDGWIVYAPAARHWPDFRRLLGGQLASNERFARAEDRFLHGQELGELIDSTLRQRGRLDLMVEAQKARVPIAAVLSLDEALETDQLRLREFFCEANAPGGRHIQLPTLPFRALTAPSPATRTADWDPEPEAPLAGIRVVDLSWVLAGPAASMILGMLGADVIKVESRAKLDSARELYPPPGADPRDYEAGSGFIAVNSNKRSLTLNLKTDEGRALAEQLIAQSDIVVDNFAAGVMEQLGFPPNVLHARNPGLVSASISTYGQDGPRSRYVGYASLFNALSGLAHLLGHASDRPGDLRGATDLRVGFMSALCIVAALECRFQTGHGRWLDISATEAMCDSIAEQFAYAQWASANPIRDGNHLPHAAPHSVYRCAGQDAWLAIAVESEAQWRRFCAIADHPEWISDDRFHSLNTRLAHQEPLDQLVGQWTQGAEPWDLANRLQAGGIAAFPCLGFTALIGDAHLSERGAWAQVAHPRFGEVTLPAAPFIVDGQRPPLWTAGPTLGQHNREVLGGLLGLGDAAIADLTAAGVVY